MVKIFILALMMVASSAVFSQIPGTYIISENLHFRNELNAKFANPELTPLKPEDLANFQRLPFFEIDTNFCVYAKFIRSEDSIPFEMKTTTSRRPLYQLYGVALFKMNGMECRLNIYQNVQLREKPEYQNSLFLPFTDITNGESTYGGGRYLDLTIPDGDYILLDFNKAYNPYCAYNSKYSCPVPPHENDLPLRIKAGVRYEGNN